MIKEDFSKTLPDSHSENYLKFVFSQAEKRLEDSCKSYEYTTTKTVVVLSVSVGFEEIGDCQQNGVIGHRCRAALNARTDDGLIRC